MRTIVLYAALLCAASGAVLAADEPATTAPTTKPSAAPVTPAANADASKPPVRQLDGILVDIKGRGIYTWDGDTKPGRSLCNNQCRLLWPPIIADEGAVATGVWSLVMRDDGRKQWALRGRPLYRWVSDKKFGQAGGDGVSDVWHLVRIAPTVKP